MDKGLEANFLYKSGHAFRARLTLLTALTVAAAPALAAPGGAVLMPFYAGEAALQGVYAHHLPPLTQAFSEQAKALVQATGHYCQNQPKQAATFEAHLALWTPLHTQWQHTMVSWEALSTPAVGPVLTRRSQRQIDFWPTRPALIQKALAKAPQTLADMERVGTLAKGLPAFELLLAQWRPVDPARVRVLDGRAPQPGKPLPALPYTPTSVPAASCQYLTLVAQGIAQEATEMQSELRVWATKDWLQISESEPDVTSAAMAEWVNQWLGGLERLRWMHIEKPVRAVQSTGNALKGNLPAFARLSRAANLAGWRAQWQSLRAQAQLTPQQRLSPPVAGQALVPIEALLLGKGRIDLAQRWSRALDAVSQKIDALHAQASSRAADHRDLLGLASALKVVTTLYQTEVASALDIPLGFSDADGD